MDGFLQEKKLDSLLDLNKDIKPPKKSPSKKDSVQKISYNQKKELARNIRKVEKQISNIEKEISSLEEKKRNLDVELSDPEKFKELSKNKDFFHNYELDQKTIKQKEREWGDLVSKLDKLRRKINF